MINTTITITGRLGQPPELRYTATGRAVTNLSIAIQDTILTDGQWTQTDPLWIDARCWGNTAEACPEHLTKGTLIIAKGHLVTTTWTGRDGAQHTKTILDIDTIGEVITNHKPGQPTQPTSQWTTEPNTDPWATNDQQPPF